MDLVIGSIQEGKVTGITKFGAFVAIADGKSGMVHISEVANSYVNDIREFLSEGQAVTVRVMNVDTEGRINLSIKKAQSQAEERPTQSARQPIERRPARAGAPRGAKTPIDPASMTFEDKLKYFMQDSETRLSDIKHNTDRKNGARRKK